MQTIEIELHTPETQSLFQGQKKMSYEDFMQKTRSFEEDQWTDIEIEPIAMTEFSKLLKKEIHG